MNPTDVSWNDLSSPFLLNSSSALHLLTFRVSYECSRVNDRSRACVRARLPPRQSVCLIFFADITRTHKTVTLPPNNLILRFKILTLSYSVFSSRTKCSDITFAVELRVSPLVAGQPIQEQQEAFVQRESWKGARINICPFHIERFVILIDIIR